MNNVLHMCLSGLFVSIKPRRCMGWQTVLACNGQPITALLECVCHLLVRSLRRYFLKSAVKALNVHSLVYRKESKLILVQLKS